MVVISTGFHSFVLLYERQLSGKRFILGYVLLGCSVNSLRSKSCAGLFMRMADRDPAEKAVLLECFNEEARERVRQPCFRCVGVAIGHGPNRHNYFWVRPFRKGAIVSMGMGKIVVEFFSAAISTSV